MDLGLDAPSAIVERVVGPWTVSGWIRVRTRRDPLRPWPLSTFCGVVWIVAHRVLPDRTRARVAGCASDEGTEGSQEALKVMTSPNLPGSPESFPAPDEGMGPMATALDGTAEPGLCAGLPPQPGESSSAHGLWPHGWLKVLAVILVAITVLAGVWGGKEAIAPVPYYALTPGDARPVEPLVQMPHDKKMPTNGDVLFVTVGVQPMRRITKWWYQRDPDNTILPAKAILGDETPDQYRQASVADMTQSKDLATATAMNRAGLVVKAKGEGAVITAVGKDTQAEKAGVVASDVVVAFEAPSAHGPRKLEIQVANDLAQAVRDLDVGTTVTLTIDRLKDPKQVKGKGTAGKETVRVTVPLTLGAAPDDPKRGYMGVGLLTRKPTFELPYKVDIDTGKIGGPSAGLAFTLSLLDQITPGALTGGRKVAVTGTIGPNATVGLVGGVSQKAVAVRRRGATLFIVPKGEVEDASKHAGPDMKVVGVETLEEALEALRANGGDLSGLPPLSSVPRM